MALRMLCSIMLAIGALTTLTSCAGIVAPRLISDSRVALAPIDPADVISPEELESLKPTGDGMTTEHHELMTAVSQRYGVDPRFSGFEWDRNDELLRLWWFDEVPPSLTETLAASGVAVEVAPTVHSPAQLRDAARRLISPGAVPGIFITSTAPEIDCSKLSVTVEAIPAGRTEADVTAALKAVAGFPLDLAIESFIPISAAMQWVAR
ncbi:hypothetical protein [Agromyces arachidis]|uniref:hypothetical protein n=1 Tax=Agromyces arachidis TaxID=766966 RepID=UPI0040571C15